MRYRMHVSLSSAVIFFIVTTSYVESRSWPVYLIAAVGVGFGVYLIGKVSDAIVPKIVPKVLKHKPKKPV